MIDKNRQQKETEINAKQQQTRTDYDMMDDNYSSIQELIQNKYGRYIADEDSRNYLESVLLCDDDANDDNNNDNLSTLIEPFFDDETIRNAFVQDLQTILRRKKDNKESSSSSPAAAAGQPADLNHHFTTTEESSTDDHDDGGSINDHDDEEAKMDDKTKGNKRTTKEERQQKRAERKAARLAKKKKSKKKTRNNEKTNSSNENDDSIFVDDDVSAWAERQAEGKAWGGRGYGGRGVRSEVNTAGNLHLPNLTLQFAGNELLQSTLLQLNGGHCYGLLGRNGVGKSTLLRRLASHKIPGTPTNLRILLVEQTTPTATDDDDDETTTTTTTVLEALLTSDTVKTSLLQEQEQLEAELDEMATADNNNNNNNDERFQQIVQRLEELAVELDEDGDDDERRAKTILHGLSFTNTMISGPITHLSGGWRMRLALAQALFLRHVDLLLLDEPTNHLDLQALDWLGKFLNERRQQQQQQQQQENGGGGAIVVVSHDRTFLNMICTDIIVMEHQRLSYHPGNYEEYARQMEERATFQQQKLESSAKQRQHLLTTIAKNSKSEDPKKQRQAKMMKDKKLDRIGNYRDDGKRYKQFSLARLDESQVRLAQKVHLEQDDPVVRMKFPTPLWSPNMTEGCALLTMQDLYFKYNSNNSTTNATARASSATTTTTTGGGSDDWLLNNVTAELHRGSKVALVGRNGVGKSSLLKLIVSEVSSSSSTTTKTSGKSRGKLWHHPNLRLGYISQHSVEELEAKYKHLTVLEYAQQQMKPAAAAGATKANNNNIRQYLGSFGLGKNALAHRRIGNLSGGERMRLCFATVLGQSETTPPQLLVCDEPTNHLDLETLDALGTALDRYQGAVLIVSHNQGFLSNFCNELWIFEKGGKLNVKRACNDESSSSFDELFSEYRHDNLSRGADARRTQRQRKANMAKTATKQRAGAKEGTGFIP